MAGENTGIASAQPGSGMSLAKTGSAKIAKSGVTQTIVKAATKKHFYGTIDLDPVKAKMDFSNIVDEVIQQFTASLNVKVSVSAEIQAESTNGFDLALQRTIKENCKVLQFSSAEFEGKQD